MRAENPNETTEPTPEQRKDAYALCERIVEAAGLIRLTKELQDHANRAVSGVRAETFLAELPFFLRVTIPEDAAAFVSKDDDVIEDQPQTFLATEITAISKHGAEFHNRQTDERLRIQGFTFEVSPQFKGEPTE